jgi:membrane protease YdiL (CAAX protease family)
MSTRDPRAARVELAAMMVLLLSYMWLWQSLFPGHFAVVCLLYFGLGIAAHLRRGETPREIGLRLDNVGRSARDVMIYVGPLIAIPILIGLWLDTTRFPPPSEWALGLPKRLLWATAQQYGLLAFFYRRSDEVFAGTWPPILAAAGAFAILHLPNPFLTVATFGLGALSCWLYRRQPNLLVLGVTHAIMSLAISRSLPLDVTYGMRVGPGFFRIWDQLHGLLLTGRSGSCAPLFF